MSAETSGRMFMRETGEKLERTMVTQNLRGGLR
jgi:hypothetical protein